MSPWSEFQIRSFRVLMRRPYVSVSIIPIFMSFVAISSTSYIAVSKAMSLGNEVVSLVGILPYHGLIIVKINHAINR